MLPRLPGKIMRIERNAVAANSGTRIKRHEAERLRSRGANHLPSVDVERIAKARHLIGHPDVYGTESILEQLGRFGHTGRSHGVNIFDNLRIKMGRRQS